MQSVQPYNPTLSTVMKNPLRILQFLFFLCLAACGGDGASTDTTTYIVRTDQLHPSIAKVYTDPYIGARCGPALSCNGIIRIDCAIEVDGPEIYYNGATGEPVMYCGGGCLDPSNMGSGTCTCPPKQWICKL